MDNTTFNFKISTRLKNVLGAEGYAQFGTYRIDYERVKADVENGTISSCGRIRGRVAPNFGLGSYNELCEILGLDVVVPKTKEDRAIELLRSKGFHVKPPFASGGYIKAKRRKHPLQKIIERAPVENNKRESTHYDFSYKQYMSSDNDYCSAYDPDEKAWYGMVCPSASASNLKDIQKIIKLENAVNAALADDSIETLREALAND